MSDPSPAVGLGPVAQILAPYVIAIAFTLVAWVGKLAVAELKKLTGIQASAADVDAVESYIDKLAAREVARAEDNLATRKISVGSQLVVDLVNEAESALPAELNKLGFDSDHVALMVAAALGKLQASMTRVAPPSVAASTSK